jgi:hypothetical protein
VIGVDPSWCTGGDYAVACVMSEYGEQWLSLLAIRVEKIDLQKR